MAQMAPRDLKKSSSSSFRGVALLSGALGAPTASCCAKFAFDPDSSVALFARNLVKNQDDFVQKLVEYFLVRGLCLLLMIACNALMLGGFLRGMEESGSVAGTALASAANFCVSAIYGYVLFAEATMANVAWGSSWKFWVSSSWRWQIRSKRVTRRIRRKIVSCF